MSYPDTPEDFEPNFSALCDERVGELLVGRFGVMRADACALVAIMDAECYVICYALPDKVDAVIAALNAAYDSDGSLRRRSP